jgi:hypothetical protein
MSVSILIEAVEAARMVARLAGPLPVRLVAVSSLELTSRPCPVSRAEVPAGICRQGRVLTLACSSGWLRFTIAM